MKISIQKIVLLSFILAFACLAFFSFYIHQNFQHSLKTSTENNASLNVLNSAEHLLTDMQNIEGGYRSYLITGKENLLESFYTGINKYQRDLSLLKNSAVGDTTELSYIKQLEMLAGRKAELAKNSVASFNKSQAYITETDASGNGKRIMDSISTLTALVQEKEYARLRQRDVLSKETNHRMFYVFFVCTAILSFFLTVCYFIVMKIISKRKNKEHQTQQSNEQLRALWAGLQNMREEERASIARKIHDDLGQQLTAIKIDVSWIEKKIVGNEEVKQKISSIISMLNDSIKSVRKISTQLRPSILDDLGLIESLKWQAEEFQKRFFIPIDFECSEDQLVLEKSTVTGLFRIFQEVLANVIRHAKATSVKASLRIIEQKLILRIQDNGKGFDWDDANAKNTLGLLGMKERAYMMGGCFEIESRPGVGTIVLVFIPLKKQE